MKFVNLILVGLMLTMVGCGVSAGSQEDKDAKTVERQQKQYAAAQAIPVFNWSLERHLVIQLYQARNQKAATHSVWRSDLGTVEGDCPSIGFGIPFDTSLTNPVKEVGRTVHSLTTIEQAEPNGIFASKNTAATWVMCAGDGGKIEPVYVETKVTSYPYPVNVNYDNNRVVKAGESTVTLTQHK